jgi:hypothetical protein
MGKFEAESLTKKTASKYPPFEINFEPKNLKSFTIKLVVKATT